MRQIKTIESEYETMMYQKHTSHLSIIGSFLPNSLQTLGLDDEVKNKRILRAWFEVVGEALSKNTRPIRILHQTLYVRVCNTNWMEELNYQKKVFIKKLNNYFGRKVIEELKLELGDLPPFAYIPPPKKESPPWLAEEIPPYIERDIEQKLAHIPESKLKDSARRIMANHYKLKQFKKQKN